jgi:hypothetical protein
MEKAWQDHKKEVISKIKSDRASRLQSASGKESYSFKIAQ